MRYSKVKTPQTADYGIFSRLKFVKVKLDACIKTLDVQQPMVAKQFLPGFAKHIQAGW